jgi:hypothetical protein
MTKNLMTKTTKHGTPVSALKLPSFSYLPIFPASQLHSFPSLHKKNYSHIEKRIPNFPGSQLPSFPASLKKGYLRTFFKNWLSRA